MTATTTATTATRTAARTARSSAVMAAGTVISRLTGFLRNSVIAAAIGVAVLNDTFQIANTLPTMLYFLVGGGALNAVFVPQLVRAMKDDTDGGAAYANRLLTLVVTGLAGLTAVLVAAAPLLVTLMAPRLAANPDTRDVMVTLARFCIPTMFFMGLHVVLGQILNARDRFGAMMWTPILNNVVVIATFGAFVWAYGPAGATGMTPATIPAEGVRLLGTGVLLGLAVQALALLPYLREAGFRIRPRFDWRGSGMGRAARLAKWSILFVLVNQAGLVVVSQVATWAGDVAVGQGHSGTGFTAYQYALQLWQMPQAIVTVSVMTAVLPRMTRAAVDGDRTAVAADLAYGLRTSAVAIVPCALLFVALGAPMSVLMYGAGDPGGARNIGYALMAFGLGLIPYSVQYVTLRGFYAYEDTRTPFFNTATVAAVNALGAGVCFWTLPARWAVVGMAGVYGLACTVGAVSAVVRLRRRLGVGVDGRRTVRTYTRLLLAGLPAAAGAALLAHRMPAVTGTGTAGAALTLGAGLLVFAVLFLLAGRLLRVEELTALTRAVRGRVRR